MVADDPESFADLDGHEDDDSQGTWQQPKSFTQALIGLAKGLYNLAIAPVAGIANSPLHSATLDNQDQKIGASAAPAVAAVVPVVAEEAVTEIAAAKVGTVSATEETAAAETPAVSGGQTYQTYTKTNAETGKVYSGMISGTGTPRENVANRDAVPHQMNKKGFGPARLDKSSTNRDAIRGREQQLHEHYKAQGRSANTNNPVSPRNKNKKKYNNAANKEFGPL